MKGVVPVRVIRVFKLVQYLCEFPPKSMEKLAEMLEISPKTAYKDIHVLEAVGYDIHIDEKHRYAIKNSGRTEYHLDDSEKKLIIATLQKTGLKGTEVQSIVQKLKTRQMVSDVGSLAIMKQLKIIKMLLDAVDQKTSIIIKNYKSTSTNAITRDRFVLPLYFDEMRMAVTAYDFDKAKPRIFKVARMSDVEPITKQASIDLPIEMPIVDTFGYAGNMAYDVSILMSKRAYAILTEEFASSVSHTTTSDNTDFPYLYKSRVCGYEGIGRFVLGMMTEIKVIGGEGFKRYLREKINKMTILSL